MNYQRIYNLIIENALNRDYNNYHGYVEIHHITPRCIGGDESKNNLVKLTAKEHYICHKLLREMNPNNSNLFYAYWCMCMLNSKDQSRHNISAREYERLKHDFSKLQSIRQTGKTAWNKGKYGIPNPKVALALKGNIPWNAGKTGVYSDASLLKMKESAKKRIVDPINEASRRSGISLNGRGNGKIRYKKIYDTSTNTEYESVTAFLKTINMNRVKYKKMLNNNIIYFI